MSISKYIFSLTFLVFSVSMTQVMAQENVTHASLIGAWSYFHVTKDLFSEQKIVATEQKFIFRDAQNVTMMVSSEESEVIQDTAYQLKYSLTVHDTAMYLTLFTPESQKTIGAYVRMPMPGMLEMAADPNFTSQKQLYKKVSIPIPAHAPQTRIRK
ncbi:MAG: hypothetical protein ACRCS8_03090 [Brevinema sp.]